MSAFWIAEISAGLLLAVGAVCFSISQVYRPAPSAPWVERAIVVTKGRYLRHLARVFVLSALAIGMAALFWRVFPSVANAGYEDGFWSTAIRSHDARFAFSVGLLVAWVWTCVVLSWRVGWFGLSYGSFLKWSAAIEEGIALLAYLAWLKRTQAAKPPTELAQRERLEVQMAIDRLRSDGELRGDADAALFAEQGRRRSPLGYWLSRQFGDAPR